MSKESVDALIEIAKNIGIIIGVLTFFWKVYDLFLSFLSIKVAAVRSESSKLVIIRTEVENKGLQAKKIDVAFILYCPELEQLDDTVRILDNEHLSKDFQSANDFVARIMFLSKNVPNVMSNGIKANGRGIVALPFYFRENIEVGDERLTCDVTIDTSAFPPGPYAVRFYLFGTSRLHRLVQTVFIVP